MASEGANESPLTGPEHVESGSNGRPDNAGTRTGEGVSPEVRAGGFPPDSNAGNQPRAAQPPAVHVPPPPLRPPSPRSSLWPDRLSAVTASLHQWLSQPRVRLAVIGMILLLIGGLAMTNSVWTLPVVVVGGLMVVIAWIGCRLDGRFEVEWGETGTKLEFRAKIRAAQPARPALSRTSSSSHKLVRTPEPESAGAEIIDGEAHTIEIEVAELEALIAAAETAEAELAQSRTSPAGKAT